MEQLTKEELTFLYSANEDCEGNISIKIKQRFKIRYICIPFIIIMLGILSVFFVK